MSLPGDEITSFFDKLDAQIGDVEVSTSNESEQHKRIDYLIHKVFAQSEDGRDLLTIWEESLKMRPCAPANAGLLEIGKNEGMKDFIRKIILTIRNVENE